MAAGIVIAIVIILAVGALVVLPMLSSGGFSLPSGNGGEPVPTSTPTSSSSSGSTTLNPKGTVVPVETQAAVIPPKGIFVHVNYIAGFAGRFGMPSALTVVPGNSLDRVWEVENANGTVIAEFTKQDGSKHALLVEIYKDGALLTKGSTTIGHGEVKLSVDTDTGVAATPITSGGGIEATAATTPASVVTTSTAATPTGSVATTGTTPVTTTPPVANQTTSSP